MPAKKYFTEEEKRQARLNRQRNYRKNNPEKIKEQSKKASIKRKDKKAIYQKRYRSKNKEKLKAYSNIYYKENSNKIKTRMSEWAQLNRNKCLLHSRKDYRKNRNKRLKTCKQWQDNNKGLWKIYRAIRRERGRNIGEFIDKNLFKKVYLKFNNQCFNCKSTEKLSVDHHYPLSKGFSLSINNAVLLCKSCNSSKSIKLPEYFYSPEQLTDLQLNYGISKSPLKEEQPSLFEARMPKNLERDNGILEAMNAA